MSNSSINIQTTEFKGHNLGTGTTIYDSVSPFNQLNFKSLVGAGSILVISGGSEVTISASTASGEANAGTNVGTGAQVYKDKLGTNLRFKTLLGTGSVGISTVGDEIFISAGTEALGAGNAYEIQFKAPTGTSLNASSGFTFSAATQSFTVGTRGTCGEGYRSSTQGNGNNAIGYYSHAGGQSSTTCGYASFSHGQTNSALADNSAILGGQNNNIAIGNTNATILGGNNIDLTGTSYIDTTGVGSLAIITSPANNVTSDEILVRNTSTGVIDYISKASIGATDIYVSGGTLDGSAQLALARSEGQSDVNIDLSALSATTDIYVSGGTLDGSAQLNLGRSEGQSDVVIDLSALSATTDIYVSGGTLDGSAQLNLARSEGQSDIVIDLSALSATTDIYVSAGTLNGSAQLNLARSEGQSDIVIDLSALSGGTSGDGVVSGGTLNGSAQLILNRTESLPDVNIDLSALSATTDIYVSGGTLDGSAQLNLARSEGQSDVSIDLSALSGGTGGGSTNFPNTLWVSVSGNNSTASVGDITKPFATFTCALTEANGLSPTINNRSLICVSTGCYPNQTVSSCNYVDWYFDHGAYVCHNSTGVVTISNVNSNIYGYGCFRMGDGITGFGVNLNNVTGCTQFHSVKKCATNGAALNISGGIQDVNFGYAYNGCSSGSLIFGVDINDGNIKMNGGCILTCGGNSLRVEGTLYGNINIDKIVATGTTSSGVIVGTLTGGVDICTPKIIAGRRGVLITSATGNITWGGDMIGSIAAAFNPFDLLAVGSDISIRGGSVIETAAAVCSINSGSAQTIKILGNAVANTNVNANITTSVGTLSVDSSVSVIY